MDPAHLHIILNHVPVIGIPVGTAILTYAFPKKSAEMTKTPEKIIEAAAVAVGTGAEEIGNRRTE